MLTHEKFFGEIVAERIRQERLKEEGKFTFTCADSQIPNSEKLAVLSEEFGEVARQVTELIILNRKYDLVQQTFSSLEENVAKQQKRYQLNLLDEIKDCERDLKKELIQVAAVCVSWLEGM